MSRRFDVPPLVAQAAYDALMYPRSGECAAIRTAAARLDLHGPGQWGPGSGWGPLRSQPAALIVGRHRWPVEIELLPWSAERTELGLRPRSQVLRPFPPDAVINAGLDLLDLLASRMWAWAEKPLRDLAGEFEFRSRLRGRLSS